MSVNLHRGLWRSWIVFSVLWVLGSGIWGYSHYKDDIALLRSEQEAPPEIVKCGAATDDALRPLCDLQSEFRAALKKIDEPRYLERRDEARSNLIRGGAIILAPPLVILLLIGTALWVVRGFR